MSSASRFQPCGQTILRIVVGVIFLMHGGQKFGMGFGNVAGFLGSLSIPIPTVSAIVLTLVEFVGGAALVLGLLTRWVAALLAFDMVVAILCYHIKHGFFNPMGIEFPLLLLAANLALLLGGAGSLSLDARMGKKPTPAP